MADRVVVIREHDTPVPIASSPGTLVVAREAAGTVVITEQKATLAVTTAPEPTVVVRETAPTVVAIASPAQGPPGRPGGAPTPITFEVTGVSSWTQVHSFGYPPEVQVLTGSGEQVGITVSHLDATHVHLSFPTPFTGKVVLS